MQTVSIVIPCFNVGKYLAEAVESAQRQTIQPLEITIVDDGSTDVETIRLVDGYAAQGLSVFRTENQGASAARNYGIARTRGQYVLCLDADDELLPEYIECTAPVLERDPRVGVVAPQVEFFGERNGFWRPRACPPETLLWQNCLPACSLFRRQCWEDAGGYKTLAACQDWEFWQTVVLECGWKWELVPRVLYRYRQRRGSISEYREAHRPEILRQLIALHSDRYSRSWPDVVIALDSEVQRLRRNASLEQHNSACAADAPRDTRDPLFDAKELEELWSVARLHVPHLSRVAVVGRGRIHRGLFDAGGLNVDSFSDASSATCAGSPAELNACIDGLRESGTEYLLVLPSGQTWIDTVPEVAERVVLGLRVVARTRTGGVVVDLRTDAPRHTFSVVICTYKRAQLLGAAIESVFTQRYPKDKYELIVVNNASPDDTAAVIAGKAAGSPVPFRSLLESRNGLSFARNLGIEHARYEFVAFLDDDAVACSDWLGQMNAVINEHHALVVGGRVEKVFEPGFVPPPWFNTQYLKHFFGVNYRDRGRSDKVFRIHRPLYLGGGNIAYARRLFAHFGGFEVRLGRDGRTLLAGEETYLNWLLEKHDIRLFYSDHVWIDHHVESARVTKKHLLKKAYWSAVTTAILRQAFVGARNARLESKSNGQEALRLLAEMCRSPRAAENFSRLARLVFDVTLLWRLRGPGRHRLPELSERCVTWSATEAIAEVEQWPDGFDKYAELRNIYLAQGDHQRVLDTVERLRQFLKVRPGEDLERVVATMGRPASQALYQQQIQTLRDRLSERVPASASVLVVSRGDPELLALGTGRRGHHFPQTQGGQYAGHHPANSDEAIAHLEDLRSRGADFIVFPATSLWWLQHYSEFAEHLSSRYELALDDADCAVFALKQRAIEQQQTV